MKQKRSLQIVTAVIVAIGGLMPVASNAQEPKAGHDQATNGKTCRMEQQCRWENFKKICTYVKVCR